MGRRGGSAVSTVTPAPAANVGYNTNTFTSTFNNDVDLAKTLNTGFKWYPYNFFSSNPDMSKVTGSNTGGPLVLLGDTTGPNGQILTATGTGTQIRGTAFGGGGYFESTLKFDPNTVTVGTGNGWPSWWSLALEKGLGPTGVPVNDQWPGQAANLEHYIELDFMEYIRKGAGIPASYYGTMHDWQGTYPTPGFSNYDNALANTMPTDVVFTSYNKYGTLWVPATATTQGYVQFYFNRLPVGTRINWSQYNPLTTAPPVTTPWAFGVIDRQHLSLILGTGPGATMTVQDVNVWQASAANNLVG